MRCGDIQLSQPPGRFGQRFERIGRRPTQPCTPEEPQAFAQQLSGLLGIPTIECEQTELTQDECPAAEIAKFFKKGQRFPIEALRLVERAAEMVRFAEIVRSRWRSSAGCPWSCHRRRLSPNHSIASGRLAVAMASSPRQCSAWASPRSSPSRRNRPRALLKRRLRACVVALQLTNQTQVEERASRSGRISRAPPRIQCLPGDGSVRSSNHPAAGRSHRVRSARPRRRPYHPSRGGAPRPLPEDACPRVQVPLRFGEECGALDRGRTLERVECRLRPRSPPLVRAGLRRDARASARSGRGRPRGAPVWPGRPRPGSL